LAGWWPGIPIFFFFVKRAMVGFAADAGEWVFIHAAE